MGLITAGFNSSVIVRYRIYHRILYYRNRVLTHRGGTQFAVWKTHPCDAALRMEQRRSGSILGNNIHNGNLIRFKVYVGDGGFGFAWQTLLSAKIPKISCK